MVYLDDSIMIKGKPASAGSKMLENFIAPFDATAAVRIKENAETVRLGEFGLKAPKMLPDGPLLCNDVFGHVRAAATKQGLYYIRPTYGTVSRYGLIPAVCSMDQIGVVCKDPYEGFELLSKIAGHDEKDGAMFPEKHYSYVKSDKSPVLFKEALPYSELYGSVFEILACAELSGNLSRYDGIKFGYRAENFKGLDELYIKTRTGGFGNEVKFALTAGCLALSQDYYTALYEKAMKLRRLIKESLRFDQYDVLVLPVESPLAVLAGLPSLSFGEVQLAAQVKNEGALLAALEVIA
ncbi:MAG TPA: hypothetical protein DEQ02_07495 [Ruminococcaceae bacterium]|nr:hypothetical protein [Oscillospiraceae bacterium]